MDEDYFLTPSRIISVTYIIVVVFWYLNWIQVDSMFFSPYLIINESQYWRIWTSLLLIGEPSLEMWIYLITFFLCLKLVNDFYYSNNPGSFIYMYLFNCIGSIISGFIDPSPYLGIRIILFVFYYSCKLFSNADIIINTSFIPFRLSIIPIVQIVYYSFFGTGSSTFTFVFTFLWAHTYYFFHCIASSVTKKDIFEPPNWFENMFAFLI